MRLKKIMQLRASWSILLTKIITLIKWWCMGRGGVGWVYETAWVRRQMYGVLAEKDSLENWIIDSRIILKHVCCDCIDKITFIWLISFFGSEYGPMVGCNVSGNETSSVFLINLKNRFSERVLLCVVSSLCVRYNVFVAMDICGVTSYDFVDRYQLSRRYCCLGTAGNSICVGDVILQQTLASLSLYRQKLRSIMYERALIRKWRRT